MPYPGRLHHEVPGWVEDGAAFHLRIRTEANASLIDDHGARAQAILAAARFYHEKQRWFCRLILVMPDHLHAILSFPQDERMSAVVKDWKSYLKRTHDVRWQEGYFDHRLRSRKESDECWRYIRQNPVRAELVSDENAWPWVWWPGNIAAPE